MRVAIFGSGYVGLVTGACLADVGHHVICMDVDRSRIECLSRGEIPIFEPGLEAIVARGLASGALEFTCDAARAVAHGEVLLVAVGTPANEDGAADLQYVLSVAETIGREMDQGKVVVIKSTVPVGTCDKVRERIGAMLAERGSAHAFDVVSNPEFLKEGAAVGDFLKPDRIVIGATTDHGRALMAELYEPFNRSHDRTLYMDVRSAELTKYAANAMLATKISFINEIAGLAERLGADIEEVRRGIGADPRIGHHFTYPGIGYGGSCFPKDVQALVRTGEEIDCDVPLIRAVEVVNNRQKHVLFEKIARHFGGEAHLAGRTIAVWGLSFKPNTDDMREAPSRVLMEALWTAGARVRAFDPVADRETRRIFGERSDMVLVDDKYSALDGTDALAICTEWQQFRAPDFNEMAQRMKARVIFDGRNMFVPRRLSEGGWTYISIGRGAAHPRPQMARHSA